ncbi:NAD-dependent epimerase/dehydratase family protein [Atopobacter phocae]|uniref:NAD-dependent epimerase/dehydratase family protein n=1 Tax=Atopobacter phocae TaxID=136492 RepID=UPI000470B725|nr:NAD-dependent epimerase/dehydratase family protein [Atopobacter phocae]
MLINQEQYVSDLEKVYNSGLIDFEKLINSSIFITGASGMIGSCLVDLLMYSNDRLNGQINLYVSGRNKERLTTRFHAYKDKKNFHIIQADIIDPIDIEEDIDYIIHAASNTHPVQYASDPIGTIMTNVKGTENVLEFSKNKKVKRVIFLSSVEIYGENTLDHDLFNEKDLGYIDSNTLRAGYPESKRVSEALCQAYTSKYGIDVVIPRLCRVFGPTMLLNDTKASSQFILNAARKEPIVLKSEGTQQYSYLYVLDIVSSILFLIQKGVKGEAYNIGSLDYNFELKKLASYLAELSGQNLIFDLPEKSEAMGYSKATIAMLDATKINKLGWRTLFSVNESLKHTVQLLRGMIKSETT